MATMKGPCIVCGDTNYPISAGGPQICPSCDCGIDPEIKRLKREIIRLRGELAKYDPVERQRLIADANAVLFPKVPAALLRAGKAGE